MSPVDRRQAIVEAVIPLLFKQGASVTTRQMAEAAGVAEGTIFKVFPDKYALIHEAVKVVSDPATALRDLAAIDLGSPFEDQLRLSAAILLRRLEDVVALMAVLRTMPSSDATPQVGLPPFLAEANAAIVASLTTIFESHRDILRLPPRRAAVMFRGLLFAAGHLAATVGERLTVDEIVSVIHSGIVVPEGSR
jgi:AcrR family transcriptional regulator